MQQQQSGLDYWVQFLSQNEIPILRPTAQNLESLCTGQEDINVRKIVHIIKDDPLVTAQLLRYLQQHKNKRQQQEIINIEQAVLMLGVQTTLENISSQFCVEKLLKKQHMTALIALLHVIKRAKNASTYAFDWAVRLRDLHFEEIRIAALLHDIAEILMWCFAPTQMLEIHKMQKTDKTLRSNHAQEIVFGFSLHDLQSKLVAQWGLPDILITLMDDNCAKNQRVRNVILAVDLARHAANGWDDAALPDDYSRIGDLLQMQVNDIITIIGATKKPL